MFTWKRHKDIFKGEGIYHLTFVVHDREPVLGALAGDASAARVELSPVGLDISGNIQQLPSFFPAVRVCAKQLMPDHVHVVLWVQKEHPYSIKEVARSMRQAWHKIIFSHTAPEGGSGSSDSIDIPVSINPQIQSAGDNNNKKLHLPYRFEPPYIRTLVGKGQLNRMIAYIHDNPRRAMLKRMHSDLFRLRRDLQVEGLTFTALGNPFLLDYPQRQAIVCSRSASAEQLAAQHSTIMKAAEEGAVSYSGAVSEGEKQIVRAVREAGRLLVIVLNDGFPPVGSEHERFYKPGGVYFEACAEGRLLLLEPTPDTLANEQLQAITGQALCEKAETKHYAYVPLPHTSLRWRMMMNNTIVKVLADRSKK